MKESVQNNKQESKVGQVKDYGVIMVVVSKVTGRRSVWWKCRSVKGHGESKVMGQVKDAGGDQAKLWSGQCQSQEVKG